MKSKKNILFLVLISIVSSIGLNTYEVTAKPSAHPSKLIQDKNKDDFFVKEMMVKQNERDYAEAVKIGRLFATVGITCICAVVVGKNWAYNSSLDKNVDMGLAEVVEAKDLTTTFDGIIGLDDVKKQIKRFMSYIKKPDDFTEIGLKPVPGLILHGVPGTGKTDLARAAANEAGLPFLYLSGSALHSKWRGEGVERLQAFMKQVDRQGPCLVFIDEIDGLAGKTNDESRSGLDDAQVLNAFKMALDGFKARKNPVFFMGATNFIDRIDPAIVRPGRLQPILVPVPTQAEQEQILYSKLYKKEIKADRNIDTKSVVAKFNPNWTGAQITAVVNEAAWRALEAGKKVVELDFLQSAMDYFLQKEQMGS